MIEHVWLEHGIVRWHIGEVSAQQYLESGAQLCEDERFASMGYIIDDFIDCSALPDAELVLAADGPAFEISACNAGLRHAIVSSSAALRERAYRLALKGMGSPTLMKFSCMDKAREWVKGDRPPPGSVLCQMAGVATTLAAAQLRAG
ncbi:MAG: hypothetical protein RLZZ555_2277 [Pseudomonadota bacterium]